MTDFSDFLEHNYKCNETGKSEQTSTDFIISMKSETNSKILKEKIRNIQEFEIMMRKNFQFHQQLKMRNVGCVCKISL